MCVLCEQQGQPGAFRGLRRLQCLPKPGVHETQEYGVPDRRSEETAFGMSRHTDRLFRGLFAGRSPASPPGRIPPGPCAGLCRLLRSASRKAGGTAQGEFHRRGGLYGKHKYFPQRIGGVRTGVRRHTKTGRSGGTDTLRRDRRPRHRILLRRADSGNGRAE